MYKCLTTWSKHKAFENILFGIWKKFERFEVGAEYLGSTFRSPFLYLYHAGKAPLRRDPFNSFYYNTTDKRKADTDSGEIWLGIGYNSFLILPIKLTYQTEMCPCLVNVRRCNVLAWDHIFSR